MMVVTDNKPMTERKFKHVFRVLNKFFLFLNKRSEIGWRVTSYIRESPNHKYGWAVDLAPTLAPNFDLKGNRIDPELNKRVRLLRALIKIKNKFNALIAPMVLFIFVESDHLHVQVVHGPVEGLVVAWPFQHRAYANTRDLGVHHDWRP